MAAVNDYRPFGAPLDGEGGDPYGFTGERWEGDAGLLYLMIYHRRRDILLTTVVTVVLSFIGIWLRTRGA